MHTHTQREGEMGNRETERRAHEFDHGALCDTHRMKIKFEKRKEGTQKKINK